MALHYAGIEVDIREVSLKAKPAHMLQVSPKGTVPVLILEQGHVIEQSLDIMQWALSRHDPDHWLGDVAVQAEIAMLIVMNDGDFKRALDQYKYAIRFPDHPPTVYREQAEVFLQQLELRLQQHQYLLAQGLSMADITIFPFVRQFAMVDEPWFASAAYPKVRTWLESLIALPLFDAIMQKYPTWVD